jgi:dTDP-4-dehydrorhamnose reductase
VSTLAELTQAIIENLKWSEFIRVTPVCAQQVSKNELGQRPARAVLSCSRLNTEGLNMQRHWLEALREYLARPYFDAYRELERPQIENTVEI